MRGKIADIDIAELLQPFGITKRHAGYTGTMPARVDAKYHIARPGIAVIFTVKSPGDPGSIGVICKRVHNTYAFWQPCGKFKRCIEFQDSLCECWHNNNYN